MDEAGGKGSLPDHPRNKDLGVLDIAALGEGLGVSGPPSIPGVGGGPHSGLGIGAVLVLQGGG